MASRIDCVVVVDEDVDLVVLVDFLSGTVTDFRVGDVEQEEDDDSLLFFEDKHRAFPVIPGIKKVLCCNCRRSSSCSSSSSLARFHSSSRFLSIIMLADGEEQWEEESIVLAVICVLVDGCLRNCPGSSGARIMESDWTEFLRGKWADRRRLWRSTSPASPATRLPERRWSLSPSCIILLWKYYVGFWVWCVVLLLLLLLMIWFGSLVLCCGVHMGKLRVNLIYAPFLGYLSSGEPVSGNNFTYATSIG